MPALEGKRKVFLVGVPRSGTTWLQLLLAQSEFVVSAPETHIFVYLQPFFDRWENQFRRDGEPGLHQIFDEPQYLNLLRGISDRVLAQIAKKKPSAPIILEKSPPHLRHWRGILKLYPDAYFIHIIRDPRAVVASLVAASRSWVSHQISPDVVEHGRLWISDVKQGREIASATRNYCEFRYEDLVRDGPIVLSRIFDHLGIDTSAERCRSFIENCEISRLQAGRFPADIGWPSFPGPLKEFFRIGKVDHWKAELSAGDIALIERLAGPIMSDLGYELNVRNSFSRLAPFAPSRLAKKAAVRVLEAARWRINRTLTRLHG